MRYLKTLTKKELYNFCIRLLEDGALSKVESVEIFARRYNITTQKTKISPHIIECEMILKSTDESIYVEVEMNLDEDMVEIDDEDYFERKYSEIEKMARTKLTPEQLADLCDIDITDISKKEED